MRSGSFIDGIRLSFGTLTIIPVEPPKTIDKPAARIAMSFAPLAVLPIVAIAVSIGTGLSRLYLPELAAGFVTLGLLQFGTRAMHADGLADTADGFGASWEKQRALEVMRLGDVGPMGVVALLITLGIQVSCLGFLLQTWETALIAGIALAGSRCAVTIGCATGVPSARNSGLGEAVAGVVPKWVAVFSWTLLAGALAAATTVWWLGVCAVVLVIFMNLLLLNAVNRRFGGITGDVLGAMIEISAALLLLLVCIPVW